MADSSNGVIPGTALLDRLSWRYACKNFDPSRTISDADWRALEQALVLTPSSYGLQPWKFVVVTSPEVKAQLPAISWNQAQVRDGSHVVVFAARESLNEADIDRYLSRISAVRGTPIDSLAGFKQMMLGSFKNPPAGFTPFGWAANQVYIALGNLMTCAAVMNIDACPMEGIVASKYDELLGLNGTGYKTVVACVLGYRAADDKYASQAKVRFAAADVVEYR